MDLLVKAQSSSPAPLSQQPARRMGAWRQAAGLTLAFGWKATQEMGVRSKLKETVSLSLIIWIRVTNSASFFKVQVLYPWGNQNGRSLHTDHSHQCTISLFKNIKHPNT